MGKRHSPRLEQRYEARIFGLDEGGKPFNIKAETLDVSKTGARLGGVTHFQNPGHTIGLESEGNKSRFVVVWVGRKGSNREGEVGLKNVDPSKQVWQLTTPKDATDRYVAPHIHDMWRDSQVMKWLEWRNERRLFYRMPVKAGAKVSHPLIKDAGWGICSDISTSGCFIETINPLAVNSQLDVVVRVKGREIRARAVVRTSKRPWGMGLEFTRISDDDKNFLASILPANKPRPPRPEAS